ncbi:hypothetical protein HNW77_10770 [Komagataeibacter sp. AV436]|uniref:Uncharacterized protein n=1 Tax=Komagataeibacter melomenusus TaxID=2766578 RepID=A0ABX2AF15_9PROT|nr:hypothetical protein [Komagataeibacter melomenusus]NPC66868.1 hypothetical protein [Komagataeibacter melomenusus]
MFSGLTFQTVSKRQRFQQAPGLILPSAQTGFTTHAQHPVPRQAGAQAGVNAAINKASAQQKKVKSRLRDV